MDRVIVYPGSIPQDVDVLSTNKNSLVALGMLMLDVLGSGTLASGLKCVPTSPGSLNVSIQPGRLYSLQNIDNTAYGSLALDSTHQILKQGILLDALQLACPAPSTSGFSINYLIEAAYQDSDTSATALPYYNSQNPQQPFSGPNNTGVAQPTVRQGSIVLQAKPGSVAPTGTQNTPTPDVGFTGLWVVSVANGQSAITTSNIAMASGAPFLTGSFAGAYTGYSGSITSSINWWRLGPAVYLTLAPVTGTSNGSGFGISNLPPAICPPTTQLISVPNAAFVNNGAALGGVADVSAQVSASGLSFQFNNSLTGWTASSSKGIGAEVTFSYVLA
ncbi:MAG TPA: hypothetical protein VFB37_00915 [Steroidobacteraceae bacterium]|nr:hypothetical protein [Steroidobacteraceae bacterium]